AEPAGLGKRHSDPRIRRRVTSACLTNWPFGLTARHLARVCWLSRRCLPNGRNIVVQAKQVVRIVAGFDRPQPVPCDVRIYRPDTRLSIVHHEADVRAAPAL